MQPMMQPVQPVQQPVMQQPVMQQPVMQQPMMQPVVPGVMQIIHQPPSPQHSQAPLPLYAEVPNAVGLAKVRLYYRSLGANDFKSVEMLPYSTGFAYQISCKEVWEPRVSYYIVAQDKDDRVLATAGSAQSPFEAPVSNSLQAPGPALPGATSPGVCEDVECPPGISGDACKKPLFHGVGGGCERDGDCQPGLSCKDDMCIIPGAGGDVSVWSLNDGWTPPEKPGNVPRAFAQIGLAMGLSWISAGKVTDSGPPMDSAPPYDQNGNFNTFSSWVPDADSFDINNNPYPGKECPADGTATYVSKGDLPSRYCARIVSTGLVFSPALRLNAGYFILPRLSIAALFRLQFSHGVTTFAGMLVGARVEYMILKPREKGLMLSAFLGGSFGQIQVKAPLGEGQTASPYIISGLMGAHAGATVRYRFHRMIGAFASPEVDIQFPDSLFNIDLTIGPEVSF
jgi:hypothetical protein